MLKLLAFLAPLVVAASSALAHFPFILIDKGGATARLVMSETLQTDPEVGIDILSGITLSILGADGKVTPLSLTKNEQSMSMALPGGGNRVVFGVADLGVMQRGKGKVHHLVYYPKAIVGDCFSEGTKLGERAPVELVPVRDAEGFKLLFLIDGKPATAEQEVRLVTSDGHEEDYKTDAKGMVGPFEQKGRFGAWARQWIDQAGTLKDKAYEQQRRYATLVFDVSDEASSSDDEAAPAAAAGSAGLPVRTVATLPYSAASFGAVASEGWLYVYGGHTAERHEYSTASVSKAFHRMSLSDPTKWEELPSGDVGVQGMNLAAYKGRIIRVGGMEPRNPPGEAADSHSIDTGAMFDVKANKWNELPKLPVTRSSHDVAVVGDTLYVLGGWTMLGKGKEPEFLTTMEVLDLTAEKPTWKSEAQPFSRRALIVAVLDKKIFVMGGFDVDDVPHLVVNVYDTVSKTWSEGPTIPGRERDGFAPAACTLDGTIYLSVGSGSLYKLSADQTEWKSIAKTTPRLAHRMVAHEKEVVILGGASVAKMVNAIEGVRVGEE